MITSVEKRTGINRPINPQKLKVHKASQDTYRCFGELNRRVLSDGNLQNLQEAWCELYPLHVFSPRDNQALTVIAGFHVFKFADERCLHVAHSNLSNTQIERISWADFLMFPFVNPRKFRDLELLRQLIHKSMPGHVKKHFFGSENISRSAFSKWVGVSEHHLKSQAEAIFRNQKLEVSI